MNESFVFISDIHANLTALQAVYQDIKSLKSNLKIFILGDIIDYGMRPNECIKFINKNFSDCVLLEGNHEMAILNQDRNSFSESRGQAASRFTESILSDESVEFLKRFKGKSKYEFSHADKRALLIHGSIQDAYWGKIDTDVDADLYKDYDIVICGHTHKQFIFEKYVSVDNPKTRNRKKILFVNSGSVGQPRNLNTNAQYAFCDFEFQNWQLRSVKYDIENELKLYNGEIDNFYKERLKTGI